jgi:hypothetical protein
MATMAGPVAKGGVDIMGGLFWAVGRARAATLLASAAVLMPVPPASAAPAPPAAATGGAVPADTLQEATSGAAPAPAPTPEATPALAPATMMLADRLKACDGGAGAAPVPRPRKSATLRPVDIPTDDMTVGALKPLHCTLSHMQALALHYARRSEQTRVASMLLQLPVIGLAVWAADVALRDATPASGAAAGGNATLRTLGQIGIAATAFTATRNLLVPRGRDLLYLQGWQAMNCALAEASLFTGKTATDAHAEFTNANNNAKTDRQALVTALSDLEGATLDDAEKALLAAHKAHAALLYATTDAAITRADTELAAWETRGTVFELARVASEAGVESRKRNLAQIDYRELLEQARKAGALPKPVAEKQANLTPLEQGDVKIKRTKDELKAAVKTAIEILTTAEAELERLTKAYDAALGRVAQCPKLVGAA